MLYYLKLMQYSAYEPRTINLTIYPCECKQSIRTLYYSRAGARLCLYGGNFFSEKVGFVRALGH